MSIVSAYSTQSVWGLWLHWEQHEKNEYNWRGAPLFCWPALGWGSAKRSAACLVQLQFAWRNESVIVGCSRWGKLLCLDLGLLGKRSNHRMSGNDTVRQGFNNELAFVRCAEMESGTPRDKSKSCCIWRATFVCANNISSLWIGDEGGLWDTLMVFTSTLPFLGPTEFIGHSPMQLPICWSWEVTLLTRMKFTLVQHLRGM